MRISQLLVILSVLVLSVLTFTAQSAAAITVNAAPTKVEVGGMVTFTGRTKGLPIGSNLVLQRKIGLEWTTLQASTTVKPGSSYSLDVKLNTKGECELRITNNEVVSPTVTVTVV
ncbi:hypothetical protein BG003_002494 [Podila horticola]|nr:hypothetical protein BG003_002494 [Podila horticola]